MYFQIVTLGLCPFRQHLTVCRTAEPIHIRQLRELQNFFLCLKTNLYYFNPDKVTVIFEKCHQCRCKTQSWPQPMGYFTRSRDSPMSSILPFQLTHSHPKSLLLEAPTLLLHRLLLPSISSTHITIHGYFHNW